MSSVIEWLVPFFRAEGLEAQGDRWGEPGRDFIKEVERTQRIQLDWSSPPHSAVDDLFRRIQRDPQLLLDVLSFACENILLGYSFQDYSAAARRLNRALHQAGANWEVVQASGTANVQLRRRVVGATTQAVAQTTARAGNASDHLDRAWHHAYGRDPDPSRAYAEAVKAVEAATIPVVAPNDPLPTLGKVISNMRSKPAKWLVVLERPVRLSSSAQPATEVDPIEIVIGQLDLLWKNQTDRHAPGDPQPSIPITQAQAEAAVHTALTLVHLFRSGAVSPAP